MSIQTDFQDRIEENELLNCMRCGFCLPACPTYIETQNEVHSPRGRIALMKAVRDGEIETYEQVEESLNVCLGCRACEPACPAGVNYGHMLEEALAIFNEHHQPSMKEKAARRTAFNHLFKNQKRMEQATSLLSFYQKSGLQKTTRKLGFMKLFPKHMQQMERVLPKMSKRKREPEAHFPAVGGVKATVAMFRGCLMDTLFRETNRSTIQLLNEAGCDVVVPDTQGCCGALHGHSGEKSGATDLAKKNIEAFESVDCDYIITNAGGCGAFLHDYDHLLQDDDEWSERAKAFVSKIVDFTTALVDLDFTEKSLNIENHRVTYQDSCHLRNVMGVSQAPRQLIHAVSGAHFIEMKKADHCCGSAGIYNLTQPEMSMQILDHKMESMMETNATTIITTNPGCLLQMRLGIEREGLTDSVRAVHLADYLLEALNHQ
ncbi:(Fe-S)-binding protein [Tenuibacillus multivorans]|uniref:Glycolate oxidase iron-sulfur subunit n=1 Tax=Tenuibacillus multivorans TaxID=237069 RepID=A0A1H0C5I0_9BACI|nr:(Fe-S)-binding protein [Tenuibacillus multivorans]GEL77772.1 putative glycolate oxidase iron-sulfur subunit [Tenuibacillus multivorans]SDN53106.1 glycolate oxidase iron-sulfur subunit [Tenuibacillus multivorans]